VAIIAYVTMHRNVTVVFLQVVWIPSRPDVTSQYKTLKAKKKEGAFFIVLYPLYSITDLDTESNYVVW